MVLQVSCHLCQFGHRLNHFAFVNILCSFILSLRKSFTFVCYIYTMQFDFFINIHVYYENV